MQVETSLPIQEGSADTLHFAHVSRHPACMITVKRTALLEADEVSIVKDCYNRP
jgi:hypothetical protein